MIKTTRADLESERTTFFLLGFTVILATLFVLLEWQSDELDYDVLLSDIPTLLIENDWTETTLSEPKALTIVEREEVIYEKGLSQPIDYEDFNIVEHAEHTEEAIHELFDMPVPLADDMPNELTAKEREFLAEQIYTEAEIMPQFPGGYTALNRFVFARLKYPASAYSQRIQGRVWC